jgi:hypothetical protein
MPMRLFHYANDSTKTLRINVAKDAEVKVGSFQSAWKDELYYGAANDGKYDMRNVSGTVVDLGTIEVNGVGKVNAQSIVFDTNDTLQPEAIAANVDTIGNFSNFAGIELNSTTPTNWFWQIWGKSQKGIYADTAGGNSFGTIGNDFPNGDYYEYSKTKHNNTVIDIDVYSGDYMANTDPNYPVCFGGAFFKIYDNKVVIIKIKDKFGFDPNSSDGLTKLDELFDSLVPEQVEIDGNTVSK